jgi:hypothetical protein
MSRNGPASELSRRPEPFNSRGRCEPLNGGPFPQADCPLLASLGIRSRGWQGWEWCELSDGEATAVYREYGTVDEAGLVGGEEGDGGCDLVGLPRPAGRSARC